MINGTSVECTLSANSPCFGTLFHFFITMYVVCITAYRKSPPIMLYWGQVAWRCESTQGKVIRAHSCRGMPGEAKSCAYY